ncbi:hypothetical protein SAMN05444141_11053 [Pseudovibrio denitrificans]|uniref:Uncharacterized protein n=1 Tax=Pseudovibrio denitrificans TaxID=258256 RepID=A0A1I7DST7_9HYPH|nr:hypothetical protein [Pseudovibrio denitrificans]SFU14722.1 hypothetical protein SAMN05444141_11053 [Pseudovibrio denitrificans]
MSNNDGKQAEYDQDVLIIWKDEVYRIPEKEWKGKTPEPVSEHLRVEELVKFGAAVASIPNYDEQNTAVDASPSNVGATCFLLNIDVIKGGY